MLVEDPKPEERELDVSDLQNVGWLKLEDLCMQNTGTVHPSEGN